MNKVPGSIDLTIGKDGSLTGTTKDVAPGQEVTITLKGMDKDGNVVTETVKTTVQPDGSYTTALPPTTQIVDGSAIVGEATSTDRNGDPVKGTDALGASGQPGTELPPAEIPVDVVVPPSVPGGGLNKVPGSITVNINDTDSTKIAGTTTDVAPNSKVTLEITSIDENGETLTFTEEVFTDANGEYSYTLTQVEGNATGVVAKVDDRNGTERQADDQLDATVKADATTDINNGNNDVIGTSGNDVLAGDTGGLKTNFVAGNDYNVSIVLDLSGSMTWNLTNNNTAIPPALSRLDIAKAGLKAFVQQMVDHDGTINLQLVSFSSNASSNAGDRFNQTFLDVNPTTLQLILDYIDSFVAEGGTNPERGFDRANAWFEEAEIKDATVNGFENQTYYLTDGNPSTSSTTDIRDTAFAPLAEKSKVFAVGISDAVNISNVERYDNTDVNGNKLPGTWNGSTNHGTAQKFTEADKLIAYIIGGSENFIPKEVGNDTVKGGAGDDILFGDAINTDWITGLDPLQYPQYSGYSKLIAHLKAEVTGGAEPTTQQIYDFVKDHYRDFIAADATDPNTKGGNDTIYGGAGDDIIIAGAGDDRIYGGSGNDIISTGPGNDTIVYDVLQAADAIGGNGTDMWVDYTANDKIEFGADFFDGLLSTDLSDVNKVAEFITVGDDGAGNAVIKVDRDGADPQHNGMSDLLVIQNQAGLTLQDLLDNNQITIIG